VVFVSLLLADRKSWLLL